MSGPDVRGLLSSLEAAGVGVALNAAGDGLTLSGKGRPPADLLEAVRAAKPALLEALTAKEDGPTSLPSPDLQPGRLPDGRLDVAYFASQPGYCGSCARAVDVSAEWGPGMVACTCDPVAWWPLPPPFALHLGAKCGAYQVDGEDVGRGWRAKDSGKWYGPVPLPADLGAA